MKKKSIFNASFEESINLENDDFRKFNQQSYDDDDLLKYFENGGPSTKFKLTYFFLSLIFPIGINYLFTVLTQDAVTQKQFMGYPTLRYNILPSRLFLIFLIAWLIAIVLGKYFNQTFILPYRLQFHIQFSSMIWLVIEMNLFFLSLYTPTFTVWGVLFLFILFIMAGYVMINTQLRRLKRILYGEDNPISAMERIVKKISVYGMGILGIGVIINIIMKLFSVNIAERLEYFLFSLVWPVVNLAVLAFFIFVELSHFLPAYYKLKYPELYRKYEGKSVEEWYGKKYLKKHKELTENE